jgi:hypothetical protein
MKSILIIAALLVATIATAQTKAVLKNINGGTITESLTIGSGKTLTIASGATINATGATITGFTASAAWGGITGTLSAQTDLQSALDLKATLASPTFTGVVSIPQTSTAAGNFRITGVGAGGTLFLNDVANVYSARIRPTTLTANRIYTTPDADGTFLFTDGSAASLTNFPTLNQNTTGYASALKSATTTVSVSAATAPSSGQILTAISASAATWQTPAGGGGKVLQMIVGTKTDTASGTNTTFSNTGLSATITPSATTSRILIIAAVSGAGTSSYMTGWRVARGSTAVLVGDAASARTQVTTSMSAQGTNLMNSASLVASDSPASTAALTYNVDALVESGGTWYLNRSSLDAAVVSYPRAASSIILLEIAP